MKFKILALVLALFIQNEAMARNFYKADFKVNVNYSNLDGQISELMTNEAIEVRYSDDHDFCWIKVGTEKFKCHTYHPDNDPTMTQITINRDKAAAFIRAALLERNCHPETIEKFDRLGIYLSDTIDLEYLGQEFYQEIHDEQPEVFHLWFYELETGVKY